ncbi:MAG: archaellin/type IV pilin N-terminal domain-containing protein [Nitrososphaerales archaeon]
MIHTLKNKRKAVSPIVATLLLIAISVAASVITYTFVSSSLTGQARQAQTSISIEDIQFKKALMSTSGAATVWTGTTTETTFISENIPRTTSFTLTRTTSISGNPTTATLNPYVLVTIRNKGTVPAVIQTIYITLPDATVFRTDFTTGNVIPPGVTISFVIPRVDANFFWSSATNYTVKVVTDTGFTAEGTFASPVG